MSTITFQSFEMEMTENTTVEDIREFVEYAQQYEFDREDIREEDVQSTIETIIAGLFAAWEEEFYYSLTPQERGEPSAWKKAKERGEILE